MKRLRLVLEYQALDGTPGTLRALREDLAEQLARPGGRVGRRTVERAGYSGVRLLGWEVLEEPLEELLERDLERG